MLRIPHCLDSELTDGGKVVSLTRRLRSTPQTLFSLEFLATNPEVLVRFLALPDFLRSSWSGTESAQPRESRKQRIRP
jgi:S-methylmethionine-dependent homocysteine/selenocysteine methylase